MLATFQLKIFKDLILWLDIIIRFTLNLEGKS